MSPDFETIEIEELDSALSKLYCEVRTVNGTEYSGSSLRGLRSGIFRHLNGPRYKRNINLGISPQFVASNKMFEAVFKRLMKSSKDTSVHWPPISQTDLRRIRQVESFNVEDPLQSQEKVFFYTQLCFGRRAVEVIF